MIIEANHVPRTHNRPITTLFMLSSLDGKISTGDIDRYDYDKDIPMLHGEASAGLQQYYDAEQETDLWSLNSGRVMAKVGANDKPYIEQSIVNFVILDNTHLNEHGVIYMCKRSNKCVIVTSNKSHPAYAVDEPNLIILEYTGSLNPRILLEKLYNLGCKQLTIQTGGTLNAQFLRAKCLDKVNIVICPILVGGKNVSTLVDGESISSLSEIGLLKLTKVKRLNNSYLELFYDVTNSK